MGAWYVSVPGFLDHMEPSIAIVVSSRTGKQIYHSIDSAERYSEMYGPMVYVEQRNGTNK